jgi:hypothetical protein
MPKTKFSRSLDSFFAANPEWVPFADLIVVPPSAADIIEESPDAEGCDMLKQPDRWVAEHVSMYALYQRIRMEGETHKWAEMIAMGEPPRIMTDAVYFANHPGRIEDMRPIEQAAMLSAAHRMGFKPGPNDVYCPSLAQRPGDPLAWVPPTGGRAHIRKVCEMRGLACEGSVTTKNRQPERDPHETATKMAPDVIRDNAVKMIAKNPALRRKKPQEIRDMVLAQHGPS